MILYDYSFEINTLNNEFGVINNILKLNYMNLMLISEYILKIISSSKIQLNNNNNLYNNFLLLKLYNIIDIYRKNGGFQNDFIEIKPYSVINDLDMSNVEKISYNTNLIIQYLRYILKNNKTSKNEILTSFFKKIKEKTYEEINIFFREQIFRIINKNGSILASVLLNNIQINNITNNNLFNKYKFKTLPAPYLRTKNNKKYSLVLDLDETLIHFKQGNNEQEGVVRIRPGVTEFLKEIGKIYELIVFTTATQEYADLLIDAIEEDKIYFDHRLYREHAIIVDNDFVKDLTRIGRPLDKIIIIDDMPQNFKLQKENGIIIRPFWGEDNNDSVLYNLVPILKSIANEGGDLRNGLINYKDEIFKNITSVLYI
jgi:Dullard-like phosphatase family protein